MLSRDIIVSMNTLPRLVMEVKQAQIWMTVVLTAISLAGFQAQQIQNLKTSNVATSTATLSWDSVPEASSYNIQYFKNPQTTYPFTVEKIETNAYTLNKLDSGTAYGAYVEVVSNGAVKGTSVTITLVTDGPKPVSEFRIDAISARSVNVSWVPNGEQKYDSFTVTLYRVYDPQNNVTQIKTFEVPNTANKYTVTEGIEPGTGYRVGVIGKYNNKVSTIKDDGFGSAIEILAPTFVRITDIKEFEATVNWIIPTNVRWITNYEIEYAILTNGSEAKTYKTTNNPNKNNEQELTGLKAGTLYSVKVRSMSGIVNGDWSESVSFSTKTEVPLTSPQNLTVIQLDKDKALMSWGAVNDLKLDHYKIEYQEFNAKPFPSIQTTSTMYDLPNLRSGTKYVVFVEAVSTSGLEGQQSTGCIFTTPGPKPVAPNPSITEITEKSAVVSWVPLSDGNQDSFQVQLIEINTNRLIQLTPLSNVTTSYTWKDLQSNTPYTVGIYTKLGNDLSSVVQTQFRTAISQTSLQYLLTCTIIVDVNNLGTVKLTCDKVIGETTLYYESRIVVKDQPSLTRNNFADTQLTAPTTTLKQEIQLQGLYTGYIYEVYVRPVFDGVIYGTWSRAYQFDIPYGRPPTYIDIEQITDANVQVTWFNPYTDDLTKTFDYYITYKSLQDQTITSRIFVQRYDQSKVLKITGLKPDHRYEVAISTKLDGDSQNGTAIVKAFRTRLEQPPGPAYVVVNITNGAATLVWQLIPSRSDILKYEIYIERGDGTSMKPDSQLSYSYYTDGPLQSTFTFPVNDLQVGVTYNASVRGIITKNDDEKAWLSEGQWSTTNSFVMTTATFSKLPPTTQIDHVSSNALVLQWQSQKDVLNYEVEIIPEESAQGLVGNKYSLSIAGINTQAVINGLEPGKNYFYRIRAIGTNGDAGLWSALVEFSTIGASSSYSNDLSPSTVTGIVVAVLIIFLVIIISIIIFCRGTEVVNGYSESNCEKSNKFVLGDHSNMDHPVETTKIKEIN